MIKQPELIDEDDTDEFPCDRIVCDPGILGGKPTIHGHRISVQFILERLFAGDTVDAIAESYHLSPDDVRQAILFASRCLAKVRSIRDTQ
jgi:uncharacterized protein (DUF433 family)